METLKIDLTANNAEDLILRITAELHKRGFDLVVFYYNTANKRLPFIDNSSVFYKYVQSILF